MCSLKLGLGHLDLVSASCKSFHQVRNAERDVTLDGHSLSITDVVTVSSYDVKVALTRNPVIIDNVRSSVELVRRKIDGGETMYGINTGFGASADVRTSETEKLQRGLLQLLNVGVLLPSDKGLCSDNETDAGLQAWRGHALPVSIVRGMLLIRANSLMRGHSGVRVEVIQAILHLLNQGVTPVVPLRGSISASGDLCPLSYIASVLNGNPDVYVKIGSAGSKFLRADRALELVGLKPLRMQAKEGLGIVNGTATSAAAAAVAINQAHQLAILSQCLTAMATEALLGTANNYRAFISHCRPHPGQVEAAANILALLAGSSLAKSENKQGEGLAQDRYALRTAPQWIGPLLEDLMLANSQVQIELNSTTDNPLIDFAENTIHQGGNFQGVAITSAMEKVTSAVQLLGKLMFAQCSELLDAKLNNSLPPNLAADDPSKSFTTKGLDINMAAYMSELAHLAHPVSAHVQNGEASNQAINSLALVAARNSLEAVELLSLMAATYIYALCQALDLRCLHLEFCKEAKPMIAELWHECFCCLVPKRCVDSLCEQSWEVLLRKWLDHSNADLSDRGRIAVRDATGVLLELLSQNIEHKSEFWLYGFHGAIQRFSRESANRLSLTYSQVRVRFFESPTTCLYLGKASKAVYGYVRHKLGVPMHRGLQDHPVSESTGQDAGQSGQKIIGTLVSDIYLALRKGKIHDVIIETMQPSPPEMQT